MRVEKALKPEIKKSPVYASGWVFIRAADGKPINGSLVQAGSSLLKLCRVDH